ncbi:DUF1294 domain-containing protein [Bacillus sonorensis]|uniref:DUF1294 domain-containing protein n=2 Tax=Bacillus sonorensis TaxID=119858 RepID=M5P5G1_9BACI|nr:MULTISPECIES: DUF1294 domain-containing protein [Bacillus]TWK78876.1 hypothetical protein CHCC20335_1814 [Bacillus paralicheniformis]ASB87975.1 uncharacterized protein S101395_01465 [Bacillus sonorensis]EME75261.1 hypothetical protein BSONL12_09757 [Bacillus sonorensis L12]MBG9915868.1 membrane protein [Bacillus sonorensis]MCF7617308.1 DUF1294 domain-containing protein [Bacillus sonorensis]
MSMMLTAFILINGYGFALMNIDKQRAVQNKWRISERRIWLTAALFGSAGVWLGMLCFRHKTKHLSFKLGIPFLLMIQAVLAVVLLYVMN